MAEAPSRIKIDGDVALLQFRDGADNTWSVGAILGEAVNEQTGERRSLKDAETMGFKVFGFTVVRDA